MPKSINDILNKPSVVGPIPTPIKKYNTGKSGRESKHCDECRQAITDYAAGHGKVHLVKEYIQEIQGSGKLYNPLVWMQYEIPDVINAFRIWLG